MDVTVSLDDLETLVFASGAIKSIETALRTAKRDLFAPNDYKLTEAVNRLAAEARSVRRGNETYSTPWNGELNNGEKFWLDFVCNEHDPDDRNLCMVRITADEYRSGVGTPNYNGSSIDKLAAKGMLKVGSAVTGVIWTGVDQPEFSPDPTCYYLMPTSRGLAKWRELQGKP